MKLENKNSNRNMYYIGLNDEMIKSPSDNLSKKKSIKNNFNRPKRNMYYIGLENDKQNYDGPKRNMYYIGLENDKQNYGPKSSDLPKNSQPTSSIKSPPSLVINRSSDISSNVAALNPSPKILSNDQFGWILPLVKSKKSKFLNDYMVWPSPTKKETCYNCGNRPGMWPWSENTGPSKPTQNNLPESKHCSAKTFGWFPIGEPDILSDINSESFNKCPEGYIKPVNNSKYINTITGNDVANTFPKKQEFYNHTGQRLIPYGENTNSNQFQSSNNSSSFQGNRVNSVRNAAPENFMGNALSPANALGNSGAANSFGNSEAANSLGNSGADALGNAANLGDSLGDSLGDAAEAVGDLSNAFNKKKKSKGKNKKTSKIPPKKKTKKKGKKKR